MNTLTILLHINCSPPDLLDFNFEIALLISLSVIKNLMNQKLKHSAAQEFEVGLSKNYFLLKLIRNRI